MFDLYADMRAHQRRLSKRPEMAWRALSGFEPPYEAVRAQYCAEFDADWNDWPRTEWSPCVDYGVAFGPHRCWAGVRENVLVTFEHTRWP